MGTITAQFKHNAKKWLYDDYISQTSAAVQCPTQDTIGQVVLKDNFTHNCTESLTEVPTKWPTWSAIGLLFKNNNSNYIYHDF